MLKLKDQAKNIVQLTSEKEKLVNENEALKQQLKRMSQSLESASLDKEKIKALQQHLNQQQLILQQLQNRLKEYEAKIFASTSEEKKAVSDLESRLRSNAENIQLLNHQVNDI